MEFSKRAREAEGKGKKKGKRRIYMLMLYFMVGIFLGGCGNEKTDSKEDISTESKSTETEKTADEILPAWQTQEEGVGDVLPDWEEGTEPVSELEAEEEIVEEYERQRNQ